jgi:hypothetical protein
MKLSLLEASKKIGMVKSSVQKSIKDGKLSAIKNEKGRYEIDSSELFRAFPNKFNERLKSTNKEQKNTEQLNSQVVTYEAQIKILTDTLNEARADRDEWRKQAQNLVLTDQRKSKRRGFLGLFQKF